jgi:hypothetical protein
MEDKIKELEKRIEELERRPYQIPVHPPITWVHLLMMDIINVIYVGNTYQQEILISAQNLMQTQCQLTRTIYFKP